MLFFYTISFSNEQMSLFNTVNNMNSFYLYLKYCTNYFVFCFKQIVILACLIAEMFFSFLRSLLNNGYLSFVSFNYDLNHCDAHATTVGDIIWRQFYLTNETKCQRNKLLSTFGKVFISCILKAFLHDLIANEKKTLKKGTGKSTDAGMVAVFEGGRIN